MKEKFNKEDLEFDSSVTENSKGSPILGRITGPCADIVSATRNGRKYSEALWEKVFKDPIVKEYFAAGGIFGELNHPTDREETDLEKVAICMPEPPVKDSNGKLIGKWDILDTPNGRIAHCLFKYGYKLGISSRGSGDTFTDYDGQESVDPDSYTLQGFDLVYLPAVKAARLSLVNESLDSRSRTLRTALNEALENSTEDERRIMTETLNKLNIDYTPEEVMDEAAASQTTPEKGDNIDVVDNTSVAADDDGADIVNQLQEAIQLQNELENQIKTLNEKLSVCYTKETRYVEALRRNKTHISQLSSEKLALEESLENAQTQIATHSKTIDELNQTISTQRSKIQKLEESVTASKNNLKTLNENIATGNSQVRLLEEKLSTMQKDFNKEKEILERKNASLQESLQDAQKDVKILRSQTAASNAKASKLVEKYRSVAQKAVDKYIESQAVKLGVSVQDIKRRLSESYSFNDIDAVCESLQSYRLNMNSLPFRVNESALPKNPVKMTVKQSKEVISPSLNTADNIDDDVDDSLLNIIR